MAKCKLTNQKKFKALLLTLILLLVSCAYIFSACGTNDDDDDDENTTKTDTQTFANADFEYFDNNSKSYLIPTANSWSKSSGSNALGESASSSLAKSGIMDTSLVWSDVFPQAKKDYDTYKDTDKDDTRNGLEDRDQRQGNGGELGCPGQENAEEQAQHKAD